MNVPFDTYFVMARVEPCQRRTTGPTARSTGDAILTAPQVCRWVVHARIGTSQLRRLLPRRAMSDLKTLSAKSRRCSTDCGRTSRWWGSPNRKSGARWAMTERYPPAKYCDPATGKKWSGSAPRPKWLASKRFEDYVIDAPQPQPWRPSDEGSVGPSSKGEGNCARPFP